MSSQSVTRRDILKTLAMGAVGGSVLQVIPAQAAEFVHQVVRKEKAASPAGKYTPKYFSAHQYEMLNWLCDAIIPKDDHSGGPLDSAPEEWHARKMKSADRATRSALERQLRQIRIADLDVFEC